MKQYGDGKAGQWSKRQAERRIDRMLMFVIGFGMVAGLLVGIIIAGVLPVFSGKICWFAAVVLATVGAMLFKRLEPHLMKPLDELGKERIRHLHGGQAEALVAFNLRTLSDDWHLFNGVKTSGGGDIDHVFVGPAGVYCVSTKSHRGFYAWNAGLRSVTLNGKSVSHVFEAQNMAMQLRHWLEARIQPEHGIKTVPFVHPILCAPLAAIELPDGATRVRVLDAGQLHDLLSAGKQALSKGQIDGVVAVLRDITGQAERAPVQRAEL